MVLESSLEAARTVMRLPLFNSNRRHCSTGQVTTTAAARAARIRKCKQAEAVCCCLPHTQQPLCVRTSPPPTHTHLASTANALHAGSTGAQGQLKLVLCGCTCLCRDADLSAGVVSPAIITALPLRQEENAQRCPLSLGAGIPECPSCFL
jgi:hypothetical protein